MKQSKIQKLAIAVCVLTAVGVISSYGMKKVFEEKSGYEWPFCKEEVNSSYVRWRDGPVRFERTEHSAIKWPPFSDGYSEFSPPITWSSDGSTAWAKAIESKDRIKILKGSAAGVVEISELFRDLGTLNELRFIGDGDFALAWFNIRASTDKLMPMIAVVDMNTKTVLSKFITDDLQGSKIGKSAATVSQEEKIIAVLQIGNMWYRWHQDHLPESLPNVRIPEHSQISISPTGEELLVSHSAIPNGYVFDGPSSHVRLTKRKLVSLIDLKTGGEVWNITQDISIPINPTIPAISVDGKYAIVGTVPNSKNPGVSQTLIRLIDGKLMQALKSDYGPVKVRFSRDGMHFVKWYEVSHIRAVYQLNQE